ncbi:LacI family DNA-binding transcriptional regulator [Clostridium sartagoforme]|uniref:LacI family DNA-binding transcriptional regulator n=1 Tax=Clostridium sartagoforme TaxID=84031 RepID=A0A4S2DP28_9CLOT|nr:MULTISPECIES: LacI family DNA-binding transcriptional regulator [Clostridium]KLE16237.1 hypothetical protein AAT22_07060 [Clostridium sp. C8]TGY42843.1 LacI family DNA-binding transcriptional regulator [Clostridium sartagoforme]
MKPTIKDVAREAGVSLGTVSKVINNKYVKELTKIKVDEAIKKLNYEPDIYARGLRKNKTDTIAIIIPTVWNPFISEFVYKSEKILSRMGKKLLLCNSDGNSKKEVEYINMVKQNKVDGIIAITYSDIDKYVNTNIPFVSIDRFFSKEVNYVMSDNYEGGKIAARSLFESGCRSLISVGVKSDRKSSTMDRKEGFIHECKKLNVEYKSFEFCDEHRNLGSFLEKIIIENYIENKKIDGIFACNDILAHRIIEKLHKFNINIPDDIQIIGYDGSRMSEEISEGISTIRQNVDLLAKESVKLLLNNINGDKSSHSIVLPVEFISGYTTKKI